MYKNVDLINLTQIFHTMFITEKRFNQLWDFAVNTPETNGANDSFEIDGISIRLANKIIESDKSGETLALTDWTEVDF